MQHLDEGTIHAWLDGELPLDEREVVEAHIASCDECRAAVAEARGFIAASSRILTALDAVPGGVLPASSKSSMGGGARAPARFRVSRAWMAVAAVLVLSTATLLVVRPKREAPIATVAARDEMSAAPMVAAAPEPAPEPAPAPSEKAATNSPIAMARSDQLDAVRKKTERKPMIVAQAPAAPALEQPQSPFASAPVAKDAAKSSSALAGKMADERSTQREAAANMGIPITGRVVSEAGAPLSSASVQLEGTGIVTLTHDDGSYALLVPAARADGKTKSLVARLIGYKAATVPIAPAGDSISQDFVLRTNPLRLGQVVVAGEGTTSNTEKLGSSVNSADAERVESRAAPNGRARETVVGGNGKRNGLFLANGAFAELTSQTSSGESGEPVEVSLYRVGARYITFIDRLRPDTTQGTFHDPVVTMIEEKYDKQGATINRLAWTDSEGRLRTLRGAVSLATLQQLRGALDHPTP